MALGRKRRRQTRVMLGSVALATGFVLGTGHALPIPDRATLARIAAPSASPASVVARSVRETGNSAQGVVAVSQASLTRSVGKAIAGRAGRVSVAVFDARTRQTWQFHPDEPPFSTASIVKVEIVAATLIRAQREKRSLTPGEAALARAAITYSDNDATTTLFDGIGVPEVRKTNDELGLTGTTIDYRWGLTTTTALDQVRLLNQVVYRPSGSHALLTNSSRRVLIDLMAQVIPEQRWGISAGPADDDDADVWNKNGWRPRDDGSWQVNSIGHVLGDHRDYTIAILTEGTDSEFSGHELIEAVSRAVWRALARPLAPPPLPRQAHGLSI